MTVEIVRSKFRNALNGLLIVPRYVRMHCALALLLIMGVTLPAAAQKYDQEKDSDMVTKDGVDYLKVEKKGCGFDPNCSFSIYDATGTKVMIVTMESFVDPAAVSKSDPKGNVSYSTYNFLAQSKKADYATVRMNAAKLIKDVDKNELFKDGMLDETAVEEFVLVNGSKFTQQRESIIRVISR